MSADERPQSSDGAPSGEEGAGEQPRALDIHRLAEAIKGPREVRSLALAGLLALAVLYSLAVARAFLIPIVLAILLKLLLGPAIRLLQRRGVPLWLGSVLILGTVTLIVVASLIRIAEPAQDWLAELPQTLHSIRHKLEEVRAPVEKVSEAAEQVEEIANGGDQVTEVRVERLTLSELLMQRTRAALAGVAVTFGLLYFLLASGDLFLLKMVRVLPRLGERKRAVEIARTIEADISRYLLTITMVNFSLGVAVGLAMHLLEIPNPVLWGVIAFLFNYVPYLGAATGTALVGLVSYSTFDDPWRALWAPGTYLALTLFEGNFVTPTILGRRLELNPVAIFVGLLFWGWLWGIPGALLAVPMMVAIKIFCDRVEPLAPIGEFLGP